MEQFIATLLQSSLESSTKLIKVPERVKQNALATIWRFICTKQEEIKKLLQSGTEFKGVFKKRKQQKTLEMLEDLLRMYEDLNDFKRSDIYSQV